MGEFSVAWLLCLIRWLYECQTIQALIQTQIRHICQLVLRLILRAFRIHPLLCYSFYLKACMLQEWVTTTAWFLELKADQRQYCTVYLVVFTLFNITGPLA